ncbi:hypothetical protein ACWED2_06140 [Amycolatopsis sp. NPDC005003]
MDGAAARSVIAEQNRNVRDALALFSSQLSQQARAANASLAPWAAERVERRRPSPRGGTPDSFYDAVAEYEAVMARQRARFKPPPPPDPATVPVPVDPRLRQRLVTAATWLSDSCALADRWSGLKNFDGWVSFDTDGTGEASYLLDQAIQPGAAYSPAYLRAKVQDICKALLSISTKLRDFPVPDSLIDVPDIVHAPRFARLKEGILARLITEDLETQIKAGRQLERSPESTGSSSPPVLQWVVDAANVLRGLSPEVLQGFGRLVSGSTACTCPGVASPFTLAESYLVLGLDYLEEVRERMPDYAEASGQRAPEPRISMTIKGGTINGMQIATVNSTLASVVNQSGSDTATALEALKQAVLSHDGLDSEATQELIDNVEYLAEAAEKPPEKRNRGIIKLALAALTGAATAGTELGKVMNSWGDVLHKIMP